MAVHLYMRTLLKRTRIASFAFRPSVASASNGGVSSRQRAHQGPYWDPRRRDEPPMGFGPRCRARNGGNYQRSWISENDENGLTLGELGPNPLEFRVDRLRAGAEYDEPFQASLIPGRAVKTFSRHTLRKRFRTACKVLGAARLETLTIHHGRYMFISHAQAGGKSLAEVRDAAGHANVSITSGYLHVAVDDEAGVGNLFRLL